MNKKKVLLCFVILVLIVVSMNSIALANSNTERKDFLSNSELEGINDILLYVYHDRYNFGLESVNFNNLLIGERIIGYECINNSLTESIHYYPIFEEDNLIGFSYTKDDQHFHFDTSLAFYLNEKRMINSLSSFVFDSESFYYYNGLAYEKVLDLPEKVSSRDVLNKDIISSSDVSLIPLKGKYRLSIEDSIKSTTSYYSCTVSFKTQQPYNKICWAACTAMIANNQNGTTLTAVNVAQNRYGTTNFNKTLSTVYVASNYVNHYNVLYTYKNKKLTDSIILKNIRNGYPVHGSLEWNGGGWHALVVYGINSTSGYISLKDPWLNDTYGNATAYHDGSYYVYTSSYGSTGKFKKGICKKW